MISEVESTENTFATFGGVADRTLSGSEDPGGLSDSRSAELSVPAAGMRPADSDVEDPDRAGLTLPAVSDDRRDELAISEENSGGQRSGVNGDAVKRVPTASSGHGTNGAGAEILDLEEGGVGLPPDEGRIKEANRRKGILETFHTLIGAGQTRAAAAKQVGTPHVTLWRWEKAHAEKGFAGLIPETEKCGRDPIWKKLGLTEEQFKAIMEEVRGINLDTKSVTASLRLYANSDRCPPELAAVILDPTRCSKHALPPSLRNAARNSDPLNLAHRGPRALALKGAWTPRRLDIIPGDIFSSDDTTPIWGFYVPWVESKEYPFGVKLLQGQWLPVIDVASQKPVSDVLIARETSSYRASDIWHLFGHTFETVGLPRLGLQLERGSWDSNLIQGALLEYRSEHCGPHQAPEVSHERRIGGLRQLPTNITSWHEAKLQGVPFPKTLQTWTSYLPKSKSIEAFFARTQTFEGTLWGSLGRDQMRAPFEKTKKIFEACRRGSADPRLHFLSITELLERLHKILDYISYEPMEGEVFKGIPANNWQKAIDDYPLKRMPEELKYLYRREWTMGQVNGYFVRVRLKHPVSGERYSLFYANPEVFAKYPGETVAVYYDQDDFENPAQIILARTGEFLCEAQYENRTGSFLSGDASGHDMRKRWKNSVMSIYSTLVKHAPSRQVPEEIAQRRAEAKAVERGERPGNPGVVTVDRRPAAVVLPASRSSGPTPEEITSQRNDFAQQAAIAAQLRALRGEE